MTRISELECKLRFVIEQKTEPADQPILESKSSNDDEQESMKKLIEGLVLRCKELEIKCHAQQEQIARLNAKNTDFKSAEEAADVQEELNRLDAQCRAKEQVIESKDVEIRSLQEKIKNVGGPSESEDILESSERVRELDAMCEELRAELFSAKTQLEASEASLAAREQLLSFQAAVNDLDCGAHAPGHISKLAEESEIHIRDLEMELNEKTRIVHELEGSVFDLKYRLQEADASKENESEAETKDTAIRMQIEAMQAKLVSTEDHLKRILSTEAGASAANHIDEIDSLRSHVVSLALALERSENNRADSIGRLVSERETHAHSLRCLSENVKRFYSTVTFGND